MRRDARSPAHRHPSPVRRERKPMNRIALPLGLAALLISSSASAMKVPTGSDDLNLNVNVLLQARYEGTFEGSVERSFEDRKSTRLNSSHLVISYAVFCLKKKKSKSEPAKLS